MEGPRTSEESLEGGGAGRGAAMAPGEKGWGRDEDGRTAVHRAAAGGDEEGVRAGLARCGEGSGVEDAQDEGGWAALHSAAAAGHPGCVRLLLEAGALVDARNGSRATALMLAASKGRGECLGALLAGGADPLLRDRMGATALHRAAAQGRIPEVRALLGARQGRGAARVGDVEECTPVHLAAAEGHLEVLKALLESAVAGGGEEGLEACRAARNRDDKTPEAVALDSRTADFIRRFGEEDW